LSETTTMPSGIARIFNAVIGHASYRDKPLKLVVAFAPASSMAN